MVNPGQPGVTPHGDVTSNWQIVNNAIRHDTSSPAIYISGGGSPSATGVSGVTIENDTLVDGAGGTLLSLLPGASSNYITGVVIRNSILWDPNGSPINGPAPVYQQPPDVVTNSLISGPDWAGSNGNINGDPAFVNLTGGDYHLTAGSPTINAGTTTGAPSDDLDGALRDSMPDIGAYEYGAAPRPRLTVTVEQLGGSGTVTSTPAGIACDTGCGARFNPNTTVTLTATPDNGSRFLGWGGPCSGTGRCTTTLARATSVTARFGP